MSFVDRKASQKKPSPGMQHSDASADTDSNGWSSKILSAPAGRGAPSELTSGSSLGQRSPLPPRPDDADVLPFACTNFSLPAALPGPPLDVDMQRTTAAFVATAPPPPPDALPQARIAAAEARAQGYVARQAVGGAPRQPAWPLPTRRVRGRQPRRGNARHPEDDAAVRGLGGNVVRQPTDTEGEESIMSHDDNYWAWEGSLVAPVAEIPEECEGVSGFSNLTTSRSMPLRLGSPAPLPADPVVPLGNSDPSTYPPQHSADTSRLTVPDASDVSTDGPRYHVTEHAKVLSRDLLPTTTSAVMGPPVTRAAPTSTSPRIARDGWRPHAPPRTGLASFPLPPISPPLSPPLSPPPQSLTPPHQPGAPELLPAGSPDPSIPSSTLLFTPRLPAMNSGDRAERPKALSRPAIATPDPHQQLSVAVMATGEDSDVTQEFGNGPTASAGASSDSSAALSDGRPNDAVRCERLHLGGLVSVEVGSDSEFGCSLAMVSSQNPVDPVEHPDNPDNPASGSNSYPPIHPPGGPTTDLSLPQHSTLMSFDSEGVDVRTRTLDSRVAAHAAQSAQPNVWTQIAPGKVQLSDVSSSFLHDTLQDTLQDTLPDSVLDTLPETHKRAAGDSLIEETAAMPVSVAVAAWPPSRHPADGYAFTAPLRPHSAQPTLVHAHSLPRDHPPSGMHSPFQPARSFPNLQRVSSGLSGHGAWVPDVRSIQEIISTTTFQPSAPDSSAKVRSSPVNALPHGSSSPSAIPPALQFAPSVRFSPPIQSAPPRPVSPKSTTSPHVCKGILHFASPDGGDSGQGGQYSSPGVSGALATGHHRSSPLPPIQTAMFARRRVSSPGGAIAGLPLPPPPVWLQEPPTNSAYPRLAPQSAPVPQQQQHFDCGDLPEELAPSTLLDTWPPPTASPHAGGCGGGGASDADDERDSDGSDSSVGRDSLDAALGESCVLPWGLPAALHPAPVHAGGALRSPAEAAGQPWDAVQAEAPPPQSLPLPPIREESLGTEHLEFLYQSDYASTPAASAMQTVPELHGRLPPPVAPATADPAAEALDVSVSIAAAIPPAGGSNSARGAAKERQLSGDIGRSALSASGSISDGEAAAGGPAADLPYAAMYGAVSNIVLQPRTAQPLSGDGGPPSQGKGMFRFRKFLDVARANNPPTSTSGALPSPGGSSGSTLFPTSVRSRTAGPSPRETHTLEPDTTAPLGPPSGDARSARGLRSASGIDFLQGSTSAPTLIGLSHFSNPPTVSRDLPMWPPAAVESRVSIDTVSSAPLRSARATPRVDPPSSFGTTASGHAAFSGPLGSFVRAPHSMPHSMPERPVRILHMRRPPPPPHAGDAAASGSDADDEQEAGDPRSSAVPTVSLAAMSAAVLEAAASAEGAALAPPACASLTSVDTGNSTLMSRLDSLPQALPHRQVTVGSTAMPTIDSDSQEGADETSPGNPCEPLPPPMVIEDSSTRSLRTASTASTVAAAVAATVAISAAASVASPPASTGSGSGPAAGPSSLSEDVEHSHRTTRSEGSSGVTSSSWASPYPRYIFHYSMMQLSARGRDTPTRLSSTVASGRPLVSPMSSLRSSLAFVDSARALADEQTSPAGAAADRPRSLPRLPLRRGSVVRAQDSIVSISEVSDEGEEFVDARSEFAGASTGISSVSASRTASRAASVVVQPESREEAPLERAASALSGVNTAGTKASEGMSAVSNLCVAESTIDARMADLSAASLDATPPGSADLASADPGAAQRGPREDPVAMLTLSLLALSSDGLPSRAESVSSGATPTTPTAVAQRGAVPIWRSPTLSPSGRYVPAAAECGLRTPGARSATEDIESPRGAAPGHDGLEVFQRRCPHKSLVTGSWPQGHVSWYVEAWDIRDAVIVTKPPTLARRIIHPRTAPPVAPTGHIPTPPAHSATAPPLRPLSRRLPTHPEESGGSTMPVQSSLDWGPSSIRLDSMMQMTSLRPDLDADAHTHSVQLAPQEALPPGWTSRTAAVACATAPMHDPLHETGSSEAVPAWLYQSMPASMQSEIGQATASRPGREAGSRTGYGALRPQSVGNQYTSVLRSALLPRSLGWGSSQRRGEGKQGNGGRPPRPGSALRAPRPRTGPAAPSGAASSSSSILQRCKRALARVSNRRSKHASAEVPPHTTSAMTNTMSSFSSAPDVLARTSTMVSSTAGRAADADSDAEVELMPPMEAMAEDGESGAVAVQPSEAAAEPEQAKGPRTARRWLPWRRRK